MPGDCIFCKIISGHAPSTRIYENDSVVAILDIFPWTKGHTLIMPRTHAATIWEISADDAAAVMQAAHHLAPALRDAVHAEGLNLLQSNGQAAWQTIDHFHLHLIPRWFSDPLTPPTSPSKGDPEALQETASRVMEALGPA